jgi:hypothetical protein
MPSVMKDEITPGLKLFSEVMNTRLEAMIAFVSQDMERTAKRNAPWKDQTGNARNGLKGTHKVVPNKSYTATLAHGVPYGIWLEIRWSGRYSIIMPTIVNELPYVNQLLRSII